MIRVFAITAAICLTVGACGTTSTSAQRPAIDPKLESGVTSSNGGGQRQTGAVPDLTIGPRGVRGTGAPTSAGAAY